MDVPALESTQQEGDTRIFLHTLYSVQNEGVAKVVIHASDTDIITTCLYYGAMHLSDLTELWVRTGQNANLPIHEMVVALGPSQCCAMPCIHSLSGRDTTSYPYFTGKRAWFKSCMSLDIPDHFEGSDLGKLRAYKFLNNKLTLLKLLPPTENAFLLHLKRAALATITDKNAHIAKPEIPPCTEFGWSLDNGHVVPVPSTKPAWPVSMNKTISCGCLKGCHKKAVPCYIRCCCQGRATKCRRIHTATLESSDSSCDSENE
ncbi:Maltose/maltodextrin import ATP-binding protein MalK [Dissostichus eleginoides]|uniref:Maltose/maltodextrin import ATP-binding protein MalK n=1 Tax=Dissostichus eleginoides TaxID=100907 RepID=A0AAD9CG85_DISEL|nr:Maltose/maltodextrin import ATP-binding protein MalK [Dissostichus eleginoides]